jgi:hypothetical protein
MESSNMKLKFLASLILYGILKSVSSGQRIIQETCVEMAKVLP